MKAQMSTVCCHGWNAAAWGPAGEYPYLLNLAAYVNTCNEHFMPSIIRISGKFINFLKN